MQYQYKFVPLPDSLALNVIEDALNQLGKEGWHVVTSFNRPDHLLFLLSKPGVGESHFHTPEDRFGGSVIGKHKKLWDLFYDNLDEWLSRDVLIMHLFAHTQNPSVSYSFIERLIKELEDTMSKQHLPIRFVQDKQMGYKLTRSQNVKTRGD